MAIEQVAPGVYRVSLGFVNVFLLEGDGLTLIDTGIPGSAPRILAAVGELGKQPRDVRRILLTHLHADHTGSAKALKDATGAAVYMHALDAEAFQQGQTMRAVQPAPGLVNRLASALMRRGGPHRVEPVKVDCLLADNEELPGTNGLRAIYAPGHTAGQVVFLWPNQGGVLFTADACTRFIRLGYPPIFEDFELGKQTLRNLAAMDFETAAFSHGAPIHGGAAALLREKWG